MKKLLPYFVGLLIITTISCGKKEHQLTIKNSVGVAYTSAVFGASTKVWDVKLVINGIDCGILKPGDTYGPFTFVGNKIKIETFEPQLDCQGKAVYANYSWGRNCLSDDHTIKVEEFKDSDLGIPIFNKEWEWEIGYGADLTD